MYKFTVPPYLWGKEILHCSVNSIYVDGSALDASQINIDQAHIDIHDVDDWSELRLEVLVKDPEEELQNYIVAGGDHTVKCVIRCPATRMRRANKFKQCTDGWSGNIDLRREYFQGVVEIEAFSILNDHVDTRLDEGKATRRGERLASSPLVKLHLDSRPPVPGRDIRSRWVNFAESELEELVSRKDSLSYLEHVNVEDPCLYLNRGVSGLENLLVNVRGKIGVNARVRDSIVALIMSDTLRSWCAAVFVHASELEDPMEELDERSLGLLRDMARNTIEKEADESKISRWCRSWKEENPAFVLQQIDRAIHRKLTTARKIEGLCKEIEKRIDD